MEFQFVNSTPEDPAVPQDKAVRVLIRKQAMKNASAARKRDGNYGKHNLRQLPLFIPPKSPALRAYVQLRSPGSSPNSASSDGTTASSKGPQTARQVPLDTPAAIATVTPAPPAKRPALSIATATASARNRNKQLQRLERQTPLDVQTQAWLHNYFLAQGLASPVSPTDFEAMSIAHGFNLLELSTLATMHVGRATRQAISADPYHLVVQMRSQRQWSYLSFLPARYAHDPCLREAADCCVARAQQIVTPQINGEAKVLARHGRALASLQKAISDPKQCYKPEVLCATEILAMYELLDPNGEAAWVHHASGAGRMIYMRGPSRWETDFEKALLMAHIGPLMTEALITNTSTFLAEPAWQEVLRSLIQGPPNSVADNSEIVIALHMLKANIPGYFKDVCTVICAPEPSSPVMIEQLTHSLTTLQRALVDWRERYQGILKSIPQIRMETMDYDRQCKVFATYLSCQMITNRLTGTLVPYATRRRLEAQTQMLVKEMLHMERRARERKSSALLFMAQTVGVAGSVKASLGLWLAGAGAGDDTRGGRIGDEKMKGWCGIMGRKYM